jgi:hypothetical protein
VIGSVDRMAPTARGHCFARACDETSFRRRPELDILNFLISAGEIMSEQACGRAVRERYKLPADGKISGGAGVTVVSAPTGSSPQQAFGIWLQYVA